jgi:RNase P/RNase MRP subunit p29
MNDTNNVTDSNTENLQNDTSVQDVSAQVEEDVVAAEPAPKGRLKEKKEKKVQEPKAAAHMSKIEKIAAQLPPLSTDASTLFVAAANMPTADISNLISHLQIAVRRRGVQTANQLLMQGKSNPQRELAVGQRVRIVTSQNPKFIGLEGTVTKVRRIRCYVELDKRRGQYSVHTDSKGSEFRGDYFFTSDVEPLAAQVGDLHDTITRLSSPPPAFDALLDGTPESIAPESNENHSSTGTEG